MVPPKVIVFSNFNKAWAKIKKKQQKTFKNHIVK